MWRARWRRRAALLALALAASLAQAADEAPARLTGKDAQVKVPARVRFLDSGSGETRAARDKRLRRECKGRPNAGACLGLTR